MKAIYELIKYIVLKNEPNSQDEFDALDKFFEQLPF